MRIRTPLLPAVLAAVGCRSTPTAEPAKDYGRPLPSGQLALEKVTDPREIPDFSAGFGDRDALLGAVGRSLGYYEKPSSRRFFPYLGVSHDRAVASLLAFREELRAASSGTDLDRRLRERFEVYRSVGWDGSGTVYFTGYCEPVLNGSLERTGRFRYPLYRTPPDLVRTEEGVPLGRRTASGDLVPYPTRGEIDGEGRLEGKGLELVWLEDPFDAYIAHIQGSARIRLPDGSERKVGYAGKTDRPYASVADALIREGKIARRDLSLSAVRAHFRRNPEDIGRYLPVNASYVFFAEREGGPYGSIGVPVTAMCTLATDKVVYPRGALAFAETLLPRVGRSGRVRAEPWSGFVLDQDTGGAIRSAGRADLYLGTGETAEELAGHTHAEGKLHYLFVKPEEVPLLLRRRAATAGASREAPGP
ncbi:MAG TPA: MltA domain-containing protein [Planctomycetota bacterium]|jgi:membrane-bound lytic murein transglycosylase A|nr:MltA domain-containing protein [Planctomycetota bacterium]